MKTLLTSLICLAVVTNATAQGFVKGDDPLKPFDGTTQRIYEGPISIEWRLAKGNINEACEKASFEFGNKGFKGADMQACAFYWGEKCVIITKEKPTMHSVGHEIRHCFYGDWH